MTTRAIISGHVVAVGIVLAVNRVGVDVVLGYEYESAMDACGKSRKDFYAFGTVTVGREFLILAGDWTIFEPAGAGDVARDRRRRHDFGTGQVALRFARAHPSLEVAVGGRDPYLAFFQQSGAQANAGTATRRQRNCSGGQHGLPHPALLGLLLRPVAGRADVEFDSRSHSLAAENPGGGL
jgi:hypothetical protein